MNEIMTYCLVTALCAIIVTLALAVFVMRRVAFAKLIVEMEQNNAKVKALECEIESLLANRHEKMRVVEESFNRDLERRRCELEDGYNDRLHALDLQYKNKHEDLNDKLKESSRDNQAIKELKSEILRQKDEQKKILNECEETREKLINTLANYTSLTKEEGKKILLENLENDLAKQKANLIRRYDTEARQEARSRANYIIAQATTRFAGEYVNERLINVITLPNDEMKGKIIGKEGRNIKTFETITGVDIIIEDTPNEIILSSFNLYRRAIAVKTMQMLVEDGRIQPSRIEEAYEKVKNQMDEEILSEGDSVILNLGIGYIHPELKKLVGRLKYRASFGQNALAHSLEVARIAGIIAGELGGDEKLARRAGLLHDIGKALTDEQGGNHVDLGAEVCLRYKEHPVVINAIKAHHGHEEAFSIECSAVCTADVLSAARPGARHEDQAILLPQPPE